MSILRILTPLALIALLAFLLSRIDLDALQSAFSQVSAVHVIAGLALVQVLTAGVLGRTLRTGDLAVEIPMETLANVQKEIVRRCNVAGK